MRPDPEQLRDPLGGAGGVQHHGPAQRIGQPLVQVRQDKAHTLDRDQVQLLEPSGVQLGPELLGRWQ